MYGSWPDEYNAKFGPNGSTPLYAQNLSYEQIIDVESQKILEQNLITYEPYPLGYHIDNSSTYDGTHSMFSDLMDAAITKYKRMFTLPVVTLDMSEIGSLLMDRAMTTIQLSLAYTRPASVLRSRPVRRQSFPLRAHARGLSARPMAHSFRTTL